MGNRISRDVSPCSVEGCPSASDLESMCGAHWKRWRRYGDPLSVKDQKCDVDGCDSQRKAARLCGKHYQRMRNHGTTDDPQPKAPKTCSVAGCGTRAVARHLCVNHYAAWRREAHNEGAPSCRFDGCGKNAVARGYCQMHRRQLATGSPLSPIRPAVVNGVRTACIRDSDGRKRCSGCKAWLSESVFGKSRGTPDGLNGSCKKCRLIANRRATLGFYKLTPEAFGELLAKQNYACAVCRTAFERTPHVDHDHACCATTPTCGNCTRGILCHSCNVAIGLMRDDPARMIAAAEYLT